MTKVDLQKNRPLISIIIPVYNVQEYVEACLFSVMGQTYPNLEIIAVDDGSTDDSGKICEKFADKDERITVIHKSNGGLSSARNAGTDIAKGDYICYIDSDDAIDPSFTEKLYDICAGEECDMAVCGIRYGHPEMEDETNSAGGCKTKVVSGVDLLWDFYGGEHIPITVAWNKMYRRDLIGDIRYPEGRIHEDEATTFKYLYKAKRVGWTNEKLYHYTMRSGSIMQSEFNPKRLQILDAYADRRDFYKTNADSGDQNAERLLIREEYCYLSEILLMYGKVKKVLPDRKDLVKTLFDRYKKEYKQSTRRKWNAKRRIFYMVSRIFPGLYYGIKKRSH